MHAVRSMAIAFTLAAILAPSYHTHAQTVTFAVRQDVSVALSSVPPPLPKAEAAHKKIHRVKRIPPPPQMLGPSKADSALQTNAVGTLPVGTIDVIEGIGEGFVTNGQTYQVTSFPADTTGAAGSTQYVQWVNTSILIVDKASKQSVLGPVDGRVLWKDFGGNCEQFNDGDPIVLFDRLANRWVMSQFAVPSSPYSQCIAISTTSDAMGTYNRYEFQYQDFNDYGKFGVWPDGYYASFNMFGSDNRFQGSKVCAYDRTKMLSGGSEPARMVCFDVTGQGGLVPSDLDGTTPPPAGSPNYIVNIGSDRLNLWRFSVDWANPSASVLAGPVGIPTAPYQQACAAGPTPGTCIVQPKTTQRLDSLADRLMYRLAYRNFGSHESLVTTHSVAVTPTSAAVRWYEVRSPGAMPQINQQGTYAPSPASRWMGSAAMDKMGNLAIGYTVSSASVFPSIRIAGRLAGDPVNKLLAEKLIAGAAGKGAQKESDRWGDYSTMTLDPTDDCTFWYTAQYQRDGVNQWHTAIARFKFSVCQ